MTMRFSVKLAFLKFAAACLFVTPLFVGTASAIPVVDQQNLGPVRGNVGYDFNLSRGQSFTVGIDGILSGFEFEFNKSSAFATGSAYLTVYTTDGGGAPDSVLGQVSLGAASVSTTHGLIFFDLVPLNILVAAGDLMFAALHADFFGGMHSTLDTYADGQDWGCGPSFGIPCWSDETSFGVPDLVFRSHIETVSAPGALALFGLGLAGLGAMRRRQS